MLISFERDRLLRGVRPTLVSKIGTQSLIRRFDPERGAHPKIDTVVSDDRLQSAANRSMRGAVIAFVVLVCLLICALTGRQIWDARAADMRVAGQQTANLSRSLSQQVADGLQTIDAVLVDTTERVKTSGSGPAQLPELRKVIAAQVHTLPILHNVFVVAPNGDRLVDALRFRKMNFGDRAWFQYHRTHTGLSTHIGAAVHSRVDGKWVVTASRRLNHPDGSFGGVVVAAMSLKYFEDLYAAVDVGKGGNITLMLEDGTILLRKPFTDALIGSSFAKTAWFHQSLGRSAFGTHAGRSTVDGISRFYSVSRVPRYPLLVLVGLSQDEVLKEWRWETWLDVFEVAAALAFLITIGNYLLRQIRDREAAESELARLALVDGLTGLGNRRHFDEMLEREWHRAVRARTPFAFLMIDVDHFKAYNDHFGHRAGDRALKTIGACIAASVTRAEDLAVRYGGEEFAVLLPATDELGGYRVAETIRSAIAALGISHAGTLGYMTVSIGVAGMRPDRAGNAGMIVDAADSALYEAKRSGRNRSELAASRVPA
jgi:diguanylate cyclase (GGDEF)-like protein